ncbi:MAG: hypothetical protein JW860_13970 [Sedimentisphaerales bacterium]|nr:hypothetical protein [Sedimentisphaerales bacterium]
MLHTLWEILSIIKLWEYVVILGVLTAILSAVDWWFKKRLARRVLAEIKQYNSGRHEYENVIDTNEFTHLDSDYYYKVSVSLKSKGFLKLGDIEDVTLSRAYPNLRTYIRAMINTGNTILAGIYHINPKGLWKILSLLKIVPSARVLNFSTELADGRFILTSNTRPSNGADHTPPEIMVEYFSNKFTPGELLSVHMDRMEKFLQENPDIHPVLIHSLDDAIASQRRFNEIKTKYQPPTPARDENNFKKY